jgi:hypothetical protein
MASKSDSPPVEPECLPIQRPGSPAKVGEGYGHITSHKVNPDDVVKPVSSWPDAPPQRY